MDKARIGIIGPGALATSIAMAKSIVKDMGAANIIVIPDTRERRNHPRYDSLLEEYALIRRKESNLSRRKRDEIVSKVHRLIETGGLFLPESEKL